MKVTLERSALLKSLGHVHRVVERRNTIPILSNVLIQAEGSELSLKATDLDLEISGSVPADVTQAGATTVPAHVLYDIVRKLPDGSQVTLEIAGDSGQMLLRSGRSRFNLQALPEGDFPKLSAGELSHHFTLPAADLKKLIEKTQFAISNEETRHYLNGIYIHTLDVNGKTMLRAVATDGHRLARVEIQAPQGAVGMPGVILPKKAVAEIQKLIDDLSAEITIELSTQKARFSFGPVILTSKLIDGNFPPYERVIPAGNDKSLALEAKEFSQSVDRVSTISADKTRAVKLNIAKDKVTLSVVNPESGTATEDVGATYRAAALEIGFNARYLLDITGQIEGKEVRFLLSDAGSPAIIEDAEDPRTLYVLMPLRV